MSSGPRHGLGLRHSRPSQQTPKADARGPDVRIPSRTCCGCSFSGTSRRSATAGRCRCRRRIGGCSRSSPCTPARTSATRWPPGSGPTRRTRGPTCAPRCGCCAGRWATTRWSPRARVSRWARSPATSTRPRRSSATSPASRARASTTTGPRPRGPSTCAGGSPGSTTSRAATDDPAEAARWSARRCALTPLDEPAHRVLVERLVAAGDRAGALVVGRELAERLRAELGVDPAPATRALLARLRGPATAGSAPAGARGPDVRPRNRAGRAHHGLDRRAGRPRPGRARHRRGGHRQDPAGRRAGTARRQRGRAGRGRRRAWMSAARRRSRVAGAGPCAGRARSATAGAGRVARRARPARTRPRGRTGLPAVPPRSSHRPELERLRLFDAVLRLVEWAAAGRPVLLVAEDVHRADRASLALCAHIGRRLAALPVLFVLTRRDRPARPDADALLADLAGRGLDVTEIEPGPLRRAEVARSSAASRRCRTAMVSQVVVAADGNPLLAVESARALAAGAARRRRACAPSCGQRSARSPSRRGRSRRAIAAAGRGLTAPEVAALAGHRRGGTPGARHRPRPPGRRRAGVPARPARRGRAGRPARSGGHPPGRRAGVEAAAGAGTRAPPRSRGTSSGQVATTWRRPAGAGRAARPLAGRAAGGRRVLDRGAALRPGRHRGSPGARRGARLVRTDPGLRAGVGDRAGPARTGRPGRGVVPPRVALPDRRVQPGRVLRRLPPGRGAASPGRARRAAGRDADRPRLDRGVGRRPGAQRPAPRRGRGAGCPSRTTSPSPRWRTRG